MIKRMFILLLLPVCLWALSIAVPTATLAFDINNPNSGAGTTSVCQSTDGESSAYCNETTNPKNSITGSNSIIITAVNIISIVAGVAAVFMIIIGGFRYVVSAGDSNSTSGAKNMILYALVGLVVIALAQSIILFVTNKV
jgi:hypothetical protein